MDELCVLIGGKAGDGINQSGTLLARLLSNLGYFVYLYIDYPSLIRGGHNFALVRASTKQISASRRKIDYILAINQDTVDLHSGKLNNADRIIYDSDTVKSKGLGLPLSSIIKEEGAQAIMRNSVLIGAFAKAIGIGWDLLERLIRKNIPKETELNLRLARRGYDGAKEVERLAPRANDPLPVLTGNELIGLGLMKAGLESFIAYPMTPSSNLLHFLAAEGPESGIQVLHPESEIAVMLMALGAAYAGKRVAVGTSGGGFCLMTEGFSLAGMAELPVVAVVGQRPGPSTGLPTYTTQSDLHFALNAGHGEFPRFVCAPGDPEEAYYWSGVSLNLAWKYQIPAIILSDKSLSEGAFSFRPDAVSGIRKEEALLWDGRAPYKRYLHTENGISPLAFAPLKGEAIKVNSYEHDESGITIEDPQAVVSMYEKRLRKEKYLLEELERYETVRTYGNRKASTALVCWGSNKGVSCEAADTLGLRVVQPLVLAPFPLKQFRDALKGVGRLIVVENNATAQLARLMRANGLNMDAQVLKYDGRPFAVEELEDKLKEVV